MANRIGQRFNRLIITGQSGTRATALCDCGNYIATTTYNITAGRAASCGCLRKELMASNNTTHGMTDSPTYRSWGAMKRRCNDPTIHNASAYAEKGITYDKCWESFSAFLEAMGERPEGTTLDRVDGSKGYCKENCRWASSKEQWLNRNDPRVEVHLRRKELL